MIRVLVIIILAVFLHLFLIYLLESLLGGYPGLEFTDERNFCLTPSELSLAEDNVEIVPVHWRQADGAMGYGATLSAVKRESPLSLCLGRDTRRVIQRHRLDPVLFDHL